MVEILMDSAAILSGKSPSYGTECYAGTSVLAACCSCFFNTDRRITTRHTAPIIPRIHCGSLNLSLGGSKINRVILPPRSEAAATNRASHD